MKFKDFEYEIKYGLAKITSYQGTAKIVEVPSKIGRYNVYTIGSHSFLALKEVTELIIPKSIGCIEDNAFVACENLQKIHINIVEEFNNPFDECPSNMSFFTPSPRMASQIEKIGINKQYKIFCEKDFKITITDEKNKECCLDKIKIRSESLVIPDEIDGYKIVDIACTIPEKKKIKQIHLPKFLKRIPSYFLGSKCGLESIEIGNCITEIGSHAFYEIKSSVSINLKLPKTLKRIGQNAFDSNYYDNVFDISFEKGTILETVEERAFVGTKLDFKNVESFIINGRAAFRNAQIKNMTLTSNNSELLSRTFKDACFLTDLKGFENVEKLDSYAFENTKFPETTSELNLQNIKELEINAFSECSINNLYIPKNLELKAYTFSHCKAKKIEFAPDYEFCTIPYSCFAYMRNLKEIKLPESIKTIDDQAFYYCPIEEINLENIESIGRDAFIQNCLSNITFGKNLKKLSNNSFYNSLNLKELIFDDDCEIKILNESSFYSCKALEKVKLSKSIVFIDNRAFKGAPIKEINLENIENLGEEAFLLSNLEEIDLSNLEEISDRCFESSARLKKVTFSNNLKAIGNYTFRSTALETFNIPDSVEKIGTRAFSNTKIEEVVLPKELKELKPDTFTKCSNLKRVVLNEKIKTLEPSSFVNLDNLEELDLKNITEIKSDAIYNCNIKSLNIPKTTTILQKNCISGCNSLTELKIEGTLDLLGLGVFSGCSNLKTVQTDDTASVKKLVSRRGTSIISSIPISKTAVKKGRKKKTSIPEEFNTSKTINF